MGIECQIDGDKSSGGENSVPNCVRTDLLPCTESYKKNFKHW